MNDSVIKLDIKSRGAANAVKSKGAANLVKSLGAANAVKSKGAANSVRAAIGWRTRSWAPRGAAGLAGVPP